LVVQLLGLSLVSACARNTLCICSAFHVVVAAVLGCIAPSLLHMHDVWPLLRSLPQRPRASTADDAVPFAGLVIYLFILPSNFQQLSQMSSKLALCLAFCVLASSATAQTGGLHIRRHSILCLVSAMCTLVPCS
jgi:hypothetical protein